MIQILLVLLLVYFGIGLLWAMDIGLTYWYLQRNQFEGQYAEEFKRRVCGGKYGLYGTLLEMFFFPWRYFKLMELVNDNYYR